MNETVTIDRELLERLLGVAQAKLNSLRDRRGVSRKVVELLALDIEAAQRAAALSELAKLDADLI